MILHYRMGFCLDIGVNPPSLALPGSCNVCTGCLLMQLLWQKLFILYFVRDTPRAKLLSFTFDMNEEAKLKFSRAFGARLLYSG